MASAAIEPLAAPGGLLAHGGHRRDGRRPPHRGRIDSGLVTAIAVFCMTLGAAVLCYPLVAQLLSAHTEAQVVSSYDQSAADLAQEGRRRMLDAARDYNERLHSGVQGTLPIGDPSSETDQDYQSQLNVGGVMGSIAIPKISVNIPIYHGTTDTVLAAGAGHVYGTSLPVGGPNTHAVLAAHRGLPDAMLFTRLDELRKGDTFFISVLGERLAYQVDEVKVVDPTDTSDFGIIPDGDYVTLLTCTPYGINTQRLLVRGVRVDEAHAAVQADEGLYPTGYFLILDFAIALVVIHVIRVRRRHATPPRSRHRRPARSASLL